MDFGLERTRSTASEPADNTMFDLAFRPDSKAGPGSSEWIFVSANGEEPYIDFKKWSQGLFVTRADLDKVGKYLVNKHQEQTLSGIDVHGDPFEAYSPSYAARKASGRVDLLSTFNDRHMVDALDYRIAMGSRDGSYGLALGIFGDTELIMRARIHNEGAIAKTVNFKNMLPSGKMRKFVKPSTVKMRDRKLVTRIPQREWMTPTEQDIQEAVEMLLSLINGRVGNTPGRKSSPISKEYGQNLGK